MIDLATNTVTATVVAGNILYGVAITPDGAFAYVPTTFHVAVIDLATNTVTATVALGLGALGGGRGVAIRP